MTWPLSVVYNAALGAGTMAPEVSVKIVSFIIAARGSLLVSSLVAHICPFVMSTLYEIPVVGSTAIANCCCCCCCCCTCCWFTVCCKCCCVTCPAAGASLPFNTPFTMGTGCVGNWILGSPLVVNLLGERFVRPGKFCGGSGTALAGGPDKRAALFGGPRELGGAIAGWVI
jgi:hypothetical protein